MRSHDRAIILALILAPLYAGGTIVAAQDHDHDHLHGASGHDQGGNKEHAHGAQPEMTPEQAAAMAESMKLAAPSDAHKHLDYFVGNWKTKTRMYMGGPGSQAMESDGRSEIKWVLDGRFLMDQHTGTMMGQPYLGIGMTGYDSYRNMYTNSWRSNQGTNTLTMSGMRHPETGIFTYYGEMDEPSLKVTARTVKYVARIIDANHYVFEIIDLHAGEDYKVVEIAYERVR